MDARIWRTRPNMRSICRAAREIHARAVEEVVADKGYHSGAVLKELHHQGVRTYIPEPDRGRRKWQGKAGEQKRTYENRRRVRGDRGRQLQKRRSELTERSFAHLYETGGMRRLHLRGRDNILKRLLLHAAAFNSRSSCGNNWAGGNPDSSKGSPGSSSRSIFCSWLSFQGPWRSLRRPARLFHPNHRFRD